MQSLKCCGCPVYGLSLPSSDSSYTTSNICKITMKFTQACQMKELVDKSIAILEKSNKDGKGTAASQKQLAAAHVSQEDRCGGWKADL